MDANELLEPFARMLEGLATPAAVRAVEQGGSAEAMWTEILESGFLDALVAEDLGGAGLSLGEVRPLIEALGRFAVPLPVAETMVARALLAQAGVDAPDGPIALATSAATTVSCGLVSAYVLLDDGNLLRLVATRDCTPQATGVEASIAARFDFSAASGPTLARPEGGLRRIAAVLRAALMSGAGNELLERTATYANERVQFGKPIGRQQALQQNLAVIAEDVVATRIAASLGCAGGIAPSLAAAATAKSVASAAVPRIAATAHAVHGAIGVSEEHDLQLYTRRLHEWRLADGSEGYWTAELGRARLSGKAGSVDWVRAEVFA